jgi:hypothetical protein
MSKSSRGESKGKEKAEAPAVHLRPWPKKLRDLVVQQMDKDTDKKGAEKYLARFNWPQGLVKSCLHSIKKIPIRFMVDFYFSYLRQPLLHFSANPLFHFHSSQ